MSLRLITARSLDTRGLRSTKTKGFNGDVEACSFGGAFTDAANDETAPALLRKIPLDMIEKIDGIETRRKEMEMEIKEFLIQIHETGGYDNQVQKISPF